ncbi:hypothetical protein LCGC14_1169500 [marine sediment metagenome]|uniref:Uncharacterized protein n=1 Tax=marine sediment metagenome TaxID=412755 RepID=A0A0F9P8I2_9ZZZZ
MLQAQQGQTPPQPDPETDEMCGAAFNVAIQLSIYIQSVILDAATITLEEFLSAALGLGGFDGSLLRLFWDFIIASANPNLATEVATAQIKVAEHFYCANLDIATARTAINADTDITDDAQAAYIGAIDSLEDGKFALWAFIGSQDTTRDCTSFPCADWCYVFDYTNNQNGFDPLPFQQEENAATWQAGKGWRAIFTNPHVAMLGEQPFAETEIIEVEIVVHWGTIFNNENITLYGSKAVGPSDILATLVPDVPDRTYVLNWQGSANYVAIPVWLSQNQGDDLHLEKMTIKGKGTSPFGPDNC